MTLEELQERTKGLVSIDVDPFHGGVIFAALDRADLVEFLAMYKMYLQHGHSTECAPYEAVLQQVDAEFWFKVAEGDYEANRIFFLETQAVKAASEMATQGKFEPETFRHLMALPYNDFVLAMKRVQELVAIANDVTAQAQTHGIAGL